MGFVELTIVAQDDNLWDEVCDYARNCSWRAGVSLANRMEKDEFTDWERVIVARHGEKIVGFCVVSKEDCIPNVAYTPYISYIFVDQTFRGNRISEKLCSSAIDYLQQNGFTAAYLVSGEVGLYEKYGFVKIDEQPAFWGAMQSIFVYEMR